MKSCTIDECDRKAYAKGLCDTHYRRSRGLRKGGVHDPINRRPVTDTHAYCYECGEMVELHLLTKDVRKPLGIGSRCLPCAKARDAERSKNLTPEQRENKKSAAIRAFHVNGGNLGERARRYGTTVERLAALKEAQGGACAICTKSLPLVIDHDHSCCSRDKNAGPFCGQCIRGLLCHNCNIGLGAFKDNPALLGAATRYLATHVVRPKADWDQLSMWAS